MISKSIEFITLKHLEKYDSVKDLKEISNRFLSATIEDNYLEIQQKFVKKPTSSIGNAASYYDVSSYSMMKV